jgi:hypothetical protein
LIDEYKTKEKTTTQDLQSINTMTTKHFQNLINGIWVGEKLHSPIEEGNISVTILQLSNIAWKLNRTLQLNKENGHILDDNKAMELWRREYEKGWELKV